MDFALTDEQMLLKESVAGWLERNYPVGTRDVGADAARQAKTWAAFAEMGWLGLGLPEQFGGLGLGPFEHMILAETFGAHLVTAPYLSSAHLSANLILRAGSDAQKSAWLPGIAAGTGTFAFAFAERLSGFLLNMVSVSARQVGADHVLNGEKIFVIDGPTAGRLIVLARVEGAMADSQGLKLFVVDPRARGVTIRSYATVDQRTAADIVFDGAIATEVLAGEVDTLAAVEWVIDRATAFVCAEAVGIMEVLLRTTVDYVKTRRQFGQPIGDFQAIQHQIAKLRVEIEGARAMMLYATAALDLESVDRARGVSAAKSQISRACQIVGRAAIQLHGGIGMTDELSVGWYFKRLVTLETLFGGVDFHRGRFANPRPVPSDFKEVAGIA